MTDKTDKAGHILRYATAVGDMAQSGFVKVEAKDEARRGIEPVWMEWT